MRQQEPWFFDGDMKDPLSWDPWTAGYLPGIMCSYDFIEANEVIQEGWGIAWRDFWRDGAVVMPIPFNLIYAAVMKLRRWAKVPPFVQNVGLEERIARKAAWDRGHSKGWNEGYERGFHAARDRK